MTKHGAEMRALRTQIELALNGHEMSGEAPDHEPNFRASAAWALARQRMSLEPGEQLSIILPQIAYLSTSRLDDEQALHLVSLLCYEATLRDLIEMIAARSEVPVA